MQVGGPDRGFGGRTWLQRASGYGVSPSLPLLATLLLPENPRGGQPGTDAPISSQVSESSRLSPRGESWAASPDRPLLRPLPAPRQETIVTLIDCFLLLSTATVH